MENNISRLTVDLPTEIHKIIKLHAALNNLSIRDFVIDAIAEKIEDAKELNSKTISSIKKSIKNNSKLKSFNDVSSAMNYLLSESSTSKKSKKLHEKN
jgi:hypothetical protein